jgi:hypothetical protein
MNWQPIDTAPKDKRVLIYDGECVYIASYEYDSEMEINAWIESDNFWISNVTHWMPLPEPPKA